MQKRVVTVLSQAEGLMLQSIPNLGGRVWMDYRILHFSRCELGGPMKAFFAKLIKPSGRRHHS